MVLILNQQWDINNISAVWTQAKGKKSNKLLYNLSYVEDQMHAINILTKKDWIFHLNKNDRFPSEVQAKLFSLSW